MLRRSPNVSGEQSPPSRLFRRYRPFAHHDPGLTQPVDEAGTGRRDETARGVPDAGTATTGHERTTVDFQGNRAPRVVVGDGEQ